MQPFQIKIMLEQIAEELPVAREIIKTSALSDTVSSIDRGDYGYTIKGLKILEILENAIAVFLETSKQLSCVIRQSRGGEGFAAVCDLSADDVKFINMFSLFAASVEAIEGCSALSSSIVKASGTFKLNEVSGMASVETSSLARRLAKDYQDYLKFYREHSSPDKRVNNIEKAVTCTIAYFALLKNSIEKIAADAVYATYKSALEQINISIMGRSFEGFHYSAEDFNENNQLMKVTVDDVIGNADYVRAAIKLARDIAGFDFSRWENPKQVNPVLFALGSPGCGKTITAHAVGNYFLDFCKELGIKSRFVIIRRTDWASSYQNASANQLIDIFKKNVLDFKGVVGIYWPDIDTAFAARDESGVRNEEKNILGAVFGLFDGTILPKNGQWFMMCDANFMNMDKATISRITQDPYYVKGPEKPEDFVNLFRDVKLRKHKEFLDLNDQEWHEFGMMCIDYKLSGRSVENMSRKAVSMIEDFEYPNEYFGADFNAKKEIIKRYSKHLSYESLRDITTNYLEFEKEAEEKAAKKKFHDRVEEITTYLSAERFARETLMTAE